MKTRFIACLLSVLLLIVLTGICAAEGPYWETVGTRESPPNAVVENVKEVRDEPAEAKTPWVETAEVVYDWDRDYDTFTNYSIEVMVPRRNAANWWIWILLIILALIILLPAILIPVLVSSGKKKRAAARAIGPKTEYRYRCRACGHTFCFTDLDLARHRGDTTQLSRCPACRSVDTVQTGSVPLG